MGPLDHVERIGDVLERLGVRWVLGGSLASSIVGEPRSTVDIDLAVELATTEVAALIEEVRHDYYVSEPAVRSAVDRHASFNLLHFDSGTKIDCFVLGEDLLDRMQIERRERVELHTDHAIVVWIGSIEDQVLRKLLWFRLGEGVSDRQWGDVIAILRVQGDRIDTEYLTSTGEQVGLGDLLRRALHEANSG